MRKEQALAKRREAKRARMAREGWRSRYAQKVRRKRHLRAGSAPDPRWMWWTERIEAP